MGSSLTEDFWITNSWGNIHFTLTETVMFVTSHKCETGKLVIKVLIMFDHRTEKKIDTNRKGTIETTHLGASLYLTYI